MVNSNLRNNGLEQSGTAFHMYHKQSPTTIKKVALRDVQNVNRSFPFSQLEYCYDVGGKNANAVKGSGIKRSMPEMHQSSPSCKSLKSKTGASEYFVHEGPQFHSQPGKGRVRDITDKNYDCVNLNRHFHNQLEQPQQKTTKQYTDIYHQPALDPIAPAGSLMTYLPGRPSGPVCLRETADGYTKFQVPQSVDLNVINDQKRAERLIRLQRLLKQCDESDHREYIQMLLHLSPIELSKHAIELEKRSMQLSVEEGKEIKRMQALYIFGKS